MTSIAPSLPFPTGPIGPDQALANREPGAGAEPNFAAVLARARTGSSVGFDPVAVRLPLHELKSALAHVFNAFGFFPAESDQSAPAVVEAESPAAPTSGVVPAPAKTPDDPAGSDPRQAIDAARPGSAGPTVPDNGDRRVDRHSAVRATIALGREPRAVPAPVSRGDVADLHRAEPSRDRPGLEVSRPGAKVGPEQQDQIRFKIGDCVVDLLARLHDLSDDEETRLIAELQAVLEEHGFSLASATINGMPFVTGVLERNS
ncbi:MAG TPA: hypothetical protein VKC17_09675 [Sphingomicrobium sp.]|nr:hypothetical protein [Sphingomicrobium sp.]